MGLYSKKIINNSYTLLIWKIDESYDELLNGLVLRNESVERLEAYGSEQRKKEFLATRWLLKEMSLSDRDLDYNSDGAPLLKDKYISISHTSNYVAVFIGETRVGVDIERNRQQIFRIAHKFVNKEEKEKFDTTSLEILSILWNTKEALFKLCERTGIDFRKNMNVNKISLEDRIVESELVFEDKKIKIEGLLDIFDEHTLVCLMNV